MISAALTAVGGFFYAQYILFLDPPSVFSINISVQIALFSIIGGLGTPLGPIVGSLMMTPLDGILSQFLGGGPRLLIYGAAAGWCCGAAGRCRHLQGMAAPMTDRRADRRPCPVCGSSGLVRRFGGLVAVAM